MLLDMMIIVKVNSTHRLKSVTIRFQSLYIKVTKSVQN